MGEFNSKKISTFLEPDPTLESRFKNGVIMIATETRQLPNNQRHKSHMGSKFDARNDPSWHIKGRQMFSLASIVTNGDESVEVPTLDHLNLRDSDGNPVTHERIEHHLSYLNGKKLIGNLSAMTSMARQNQGQRGVTRLKNQLEEAGAPPLRNELEARDRRRILDNFDRQFLQVSSDTAIYY